MRPSKVVKIEFIDVGERPKSAAVHVGDTGDTLEVSVPERQGMGWKIVGDQPTGGAFLQGYLGPNTPGLKHIWKIAGPTGKRTIKFVERDENGPDSPPRQTSVVVTVE